MRYNFDNQPARTATFNLRRELANIKQDEAPKKQMSGLLAPKTTPMQDMAKSDSESRRVLNYMKEIRDTMRSHKNEEH
jgi:hypothetical protein